MVNSILFSPVGTTDPVRDDFEGPLLQIVRHYNPGIIYLYLTKEMLNKSASDNRYEKALLRQAVSQVQKVGVNCLPVSA